MRYRHQEIFGRIGRKGQKRLGESSVAVVGAGAIGSRSSELLARSGIGKLVLIDRDFVELGNLQSQLYTEEDIGKPKAAAACAHLKKINSGIRIIAHAEDFNCVNAALIKSDLVLDCTDNFETRFLINDFCSKNKIPWVHSAALRELGTILAVNGSPCLSCILGSPKSSETCSTSGILNTTAGIVSSIQANEAVKILLGERHESSLIRINSWENTITKIRVKMNPECAACRGEYSHLENKDSIIKFCGSGIYQIKGKISLNEARAKLKRLGKTRDFGSCLQFRNITLFKNRALVRAGSEKEAKSIYSKFIGNI